MKITIPDDKFSSEDVFYEYVIRLLQDLKLTLGPQGLYSTLRRHKTLYNWLIEFQSTELKLIEDRLDDLINAR